jgi:hypothetical protein
VTDSGKFSHDKSCVSYKLVLRHMGEQGGKGLSKWNSVQKMRFQKKQTGSDALLDFWTWMDKNKILTFTQIMDVTKEYIFFTNLFLCAL